MQPRFKISQTVNRKLLLHNEIMIHQTESCKVQESSCKSIYFW